MATVTQHDDDELLPRFGYKQQFVRSLRHFESFAVAFSFISISATGIWLAYELIILIAPAEFRHAQYYVLGALGLGLVIYIVQWITEPKAMRTEPEAHGAGLR